jgi:hypothetical protein
MLEPPHDGQRWFDRSRVHSYEDLIAKKRASGRRQDAVDVEVLEGDDSKATTRSRKSSLGGV